MTSDEELHLTAFSIVGQCLLYHVAGPIIRNLVDGEEYATYDIDKLADHVTDFTLAALDARVAQVSRSGGDDDELDRAQNADRQPGKYLGIILGIAFATLLIAQQASIFCGLMLQTPARFATSRAPTSG